MLIDSGADVSLLPRRPIDDLLTGIVEESRYELEALDGTKSLASTVHLEIEFLAKSFRGQFLLVDSPHGILGRNILNRVSLLLNGPALTWTGA
jgi:hypothetical protein